VQDEEREEKDNGSLTQAIFRSRRSEFWSVFSINQARDLEYSFDKQDIERLKRSKGGQESV
jgi:hypothetical protein